MEELLQIVENKWITAIIATSAILAVFMPTPKKGGIYAFFYFLIQKLAFNFGKARNASEGKKL